jgi:hypothetical protein
MASPSAADRFRGVVATTQRGGGPGRLLCSAGSAASFRNRPDEWITALGFPQRNITHRHLYPTKNESFRLEEIVVGRFLIGRPGSQALDYHNARQIC